MISLNKLAKGARVRRKRLPGLRALQGAPQKKGVCLKPRIVAPKKPNSGQRKIVKVKVGRKFSVLSRIIGKGHNLQKHSTVLLRAGRANDVPGVRYTIIRGKLDFLPDKTRRTSLSKYGMKKIWVTGVGR